MPGIRSETPVVNSLLIAERVYQDQKSSNWIIAGVFNRLTVPAVPFRLEELNVFFQLTNTPRSFDLHLRVEHADSARLVLDFGGLMVVEPPDPLRVIEDSVKLRGVAFRSAGKYWIQLVCEEEILAQAPLYVRVLEHHKSESEASQHD